MSCLYSGLHRQIYAQQQVLPTDACFCVVFVWFLFFVSSVQSEIYGSGSFVFVAAEDVHAWGHEKLDICRSFLSKSFGGKNGAFACSMSGRDPDGCLCLLFCCIVRNAVFVGVGAAGGTKKKSLTQRNKQHDVKKSKPACGSSSQEVGHEALPPPAALHGMS